MNFVLLDFFTFSNIDGCVLSCNYGDTCGSSTTILAAAHVSVTNSVDPWQITVTDNEIGGWPLETICLSCISNNASPWDYLISFE